jgi:hypothetical protein
MVVNDVPPSEARHRHGVPVLRALPAHDGYDNMAFALKIAGDDKADDRPQGARGGRKAAA